MPAPGEPDSAIDWHGVFEEIYQEPGADEDDLATLAYRLGRPLTGEETQTIRQIQRANPYPVEDPRHASYRPTDPATWPMPAGDLPASYLDFLRWSNGGDFRTGQCWFHFYPTRELRPLSLGYAVPQYLPGALLFGSDGGDLFYLFDLRQPPEQGEYPIRVARSGYLGYEKTAVIATSFLQLCQGREEAESLLDEGGDG